MTARGKAEHTERTVGVRISREMAERVDALRRAQLVIPTVSDVFRTALVEFLEKHEAKIRTSKTRSGA